jgi:hypothetical protein
MVSTISKENKFLNKNNKNMELEFLDMIKFAVIVKYNKNTGKWEKSGFKQGWSNLEKSDYHGEPNYAILCGKKNGISVVDIDNTQEFNMLMNEYELTTKDIDTLAFETPRGGYHLFYKYEEKLVSDSKYGGYELDILNDGKAVVQGYLYNKVGKTNEIKKMSDKMLNMLYELKNFKKEEIDENKEDKSDFLNEFLNVNYEWRRKSNFLYVPKSNICIASGKKHDHFQSFVIINTDKKLVHLKCHGKCKKKTLKYGSDEDSEDIMDKDMITDDYVARVFCNLVKDELVYDPYFNQVYCYDDRTGMWSYGSEPNKKGLYDYLISKNREKLVFKYKQKDEVKVRNYGEDTGLINKMLPRIKVNIVRQENDFLNRFIDTSKSKLLFSDGIFDMKDRTFTHGFDSSIVFLDRINRPFDFDRNKDKEKFIHKCVFEDPFEESQYHMVREYKKYIALSLAGHCEEKVIMFDLGASNCGKSLNTELRNAVFCGYVGNFNGNSFLIPKNPNTDSSSYKWLYSVVYKRLITSSEISKSADLDCDLLKRVFSGGLDRINVRKLFENDEIALINRANGILNANDVPQFNKMDNGLRNRMCVNSYELEFKDNPDPDNPKHRLDDKNLKKKIMEDEEYINSYFWIIMDAYKDYLTYGFNKRVFEENLLEWMDGEKSDIKSALMTQYEITKNITDQVKCSEVYTYLKSYMKDNVSNKARKHQLERLGLIHKRSKCGDFWTFRGLKSKNNDDECLMD